MAKKMLPKFEACYYNRKGFLLVKHFATEATMEAWIEKHAVSVLRRGLSAQHKRAA